MENSIVSLTPHPQNLVALVARTRALLANTVSPATKRGYASDLFYDWKPWAENHNAPVLHKSRRVLHRYIPLGEMFRENASASLGL
jgi:hypothetical protein